MILRLIKRDIWIVAENGDDAKDNGYAFFKYAMENKSKKDIYYVITKKSIYYDKLKIIRQSPGPRDLNEHCFCLKCKVRFIGI